MTKGANFGGVILVLLGALWTFQGIGVVGGSFMTGQTEWIVIGIVTALVGLAILIWTNIRPRV